MARPARQELAPNKISRLADRYLADHDGTTLHEVWGDWVITVSGDPQVLFEDDLEGSLQAAVEYMENTGRPAYWYERPGFLATVSLHPDLLP